VARPPAPAYLTPDGVEGWLIGDTTGGGRRLDTGRATPAGCRGRVASPGGGAGWRGAAVLEWSTGGRHEA
jgi:hypothetical protein